MKTKTTKERREAQNLLASLIGIIVGFMNDKELSDFHKNMKNDINNQNKEIWK
jgi:hypothetical protein